LVDCTGHREHVNNRRETRFSNFINPSGRKWVFVH
jgi:hypothetical protein